MKFIKRSLQILLATLLLFACCFSLVGCDLEPSEIELWHIASYEVNGETYLPGYVYNNEVFAATDITAKFENGRVTLYFFGTERQGEYRYTGTNLLTEKDSKLTITFDDGERYEGNCYSSVFDGRIDYLHFSNDEEAFYFEVCEDPTMYSETFSLFDRQDFETHEWEYLNCKAYLTDGTMMASVIERGEKTVELKDISLVEEFLTRGNEETLRIIGIGYDEEYKKEYCTLYRFVFCVKEATGYPKVNKTFEFYYDSQVDFYFVEKRGYARVGISAQKESVFAYLVSFLEKQ